MQLGTSGLGNNNCVLCINSSFDARTCGGCEFTDGMIYTSYPPKCKCTFTNEFHDGNYVCPFKFAPVVEGKWNQVERWSTKAKYQCSVCGRAIMSATKVNMEKYPYCHCGAKMSEGEVLK